MNNTFPPGWDESQVQDVLRHYESQTDVEKSVEIERNLLMKEAIRYWQDGKKSQAVQEAVKLSPSEFSRFLLALELNHSGLTEFTKLIEGLRWEQQELVWPFTVRFEGKLYVRTGKAGKNIKTGIHTAEYEFNHTRIWRDALGRIENE
jgi:hypothetical protein